MRQRHIIVTTEELVELSACQSLPNHAMQMRVAVMAGARVSDEVDNRVGNPALKPCVSLPLYQLLSGERRAFVTQHILHRDFSCPCRSVWFAYFTNSLAT